MEKPLCQPKYECLDRLEIYTHIYLDIEFDNILSFFLESLVNKEPFSLKICSDDAQIMVLLKAYLGSCTFLATILYL